MDGMGEMRCPQRGPAGRVVVRQGLVAFGLALALFGAVLAVVANVPGGGPSDARRGSPDGWMAWLAGGAAAASIGWGIAVRPSRSRRRRVAASLALAAGAAVGLGVLVAGLPKPGPSGGLDRSYLLTALGLAAMVLGALAVVAGQASRLVGGSVGHDGSPTRTRTAAVGGAVVLAGALVASLAAGAVPSLAADLNGDATTTDRPAPEDPQPVLDGRIGWSGPVGDWEDSVAGTAGGVAVRERNGLRMLDPASGTQRWSFRRWDWRWDSANRHVVVSPDGRWLALKAVPDPVRGRWVETAGGDARVWVFDAVSGRVRASFPVPRDSVPRAVDGERVVASTSTVLLAFGLDGEVRWRYTSVNGCGVGAATPVESGLLVTEVCTERGRPRSTDSNRLVLFDPGSGKVRWQWSVEGYGEDPGALGYDEGFTGVALAVTGGTVVVDERTYYRDQTGEASPGTVRHNFFGVQLVDGRRSWSRPNVAYGELPRGHPATRVGPLHAMPNAVAFAEQHQTGTTLVAAMRAIDPLTGGDLWSVDIPGGRLAEMAPRVGSQSWDPVTVLNDGRLLFVYRDDGSPDPSRRQRCVLGVWNFETGKRGYEFLPAVDRGRDSFGPWCNYSTPVQMPGAVGLWMRGEERAWVFALA
jgi:hypothetical protein